MSQAFPVGYKDILEAKKRISGKVHETPVFTSSTFDATYGRKFYFKAETLQKTGAFKARGALNSVLLLKKEHPDVEGVVTHSSGNHGMGLAWAAQQAGIKCSVVVPENSPESKIAAIKGYGAEVVLCEPTPDSRRETCDKVSKEKGYTIIPSSDYANTIAGQGTIAVEFLQQVPDLDAILVQSSGGGMASGIAIAAKEIKPDIKVFIVEPKGKNLQECLESGERRWPNPPLYLDTIADALRLQQLGFLTFEICCQLVEKEVFSVTNEEIIAAMKFVFQRMKQVVEPGGAATVAAAMSDKMKNMDPSMKHIGIIMSGANVDITHLPW